MYHKYVLLGLVLLLAACNADFSVQAPTGLTATPGEGQVTLKWQDRSFNETGFAVYRQEVSVQGVSTQSTGELEQIATTAPNVTTYVDKTVDPESLYRYGVSAKNRYASEITLSEVVDPEPEPTPDEDAPTMTLDEIDPLIIDQETLLTGTVTDASASESASLNTLAIANVGVFENSIKLGNAVIKDNKWSYGYTPKNAGNITLKVVATDNAGNKTEKSATLNVAGKTLNENITVKTQADLDKLKNVEKLLGDLNIETNASNLDFSSTNILKEVNNFSISNNDNLTNMGGFENLESIKNNLDIIGNLKLTNLPSFDKLKSVGQLSIGVNDELTSLPMFANLEQLTSLVIDGNPKLESVEGFNKVKEMEKLQLEFNYLLERINILKELTRIKESLSIKENAALNSISGFNKLTSDNIGSGGNDDSGNPDNPDFPGDSGISSEVSLNTSLDCLAQNLPFMPVDISESNLVDCPVPDTESPFAPFSDETPSEMTLGEEVTITGTAEDNVGVVTLELFEMKGETETKLADLTLDDSGNWSYDYTPDKAGDLTLVTLAVDEAGNEGKDFKDVFVTGTTQEGDVTVTTQAGLDALANVSTITGTLLVESDAAELDFSPTNALKEVGGDLILGNNPNLTDIEGFKNLERVSNAVGIINNPNLTSIPSFESLEQVFFIAIDNNASLTSIDSFSQVTNTDTIYIFDNPKLTSISGFDKLTSNTVFDSWVSDNTQLDCPVQELTFAPVDFSSGNLVNCR